MAETKRPLKVFLCHASADKPAVRALYKRLKSDGIDAWLDEESLLPGAYWRDEIPKAIQEADVVIVCLSKNSVTKDGYIQKEIKFALDQADEKIEGTIFLIPAKLEECDVPRRFQNWHWVNLFFDGNELDNIGYSRLFRSLQIRSERLSTFTPSPSVVPSKPNDEERNLPSVLIEDNIQTPPTTISKMPTTETSPVKSARQKTRTPTSNTSKNIRSSTSKKLQKQDTLIYQNEMKESQTQLLPDYYASREVDGSFVFGWVVGIAILVYVITLILSY
ncbi:MAG: toll/interleukin-1 receptor domain-containing protein [Chloroflexi bacterium]|nr:toll/interleukin-1 receptor domain-containing protein [Chloroflexota bacterium]